MDTKTLTPKIYVACLATYNSGILHGAWIDADQEEDAMRAEVAAMLEASSIPEAEEYAIHDYEGFGEVRLEEYTAIGTVAHMAAFAADHGELGMAVLAHFCGDFEEARDALEDRYLGKFSSLADYMQDMMEECASIPESLRFYIDWQAMARDTELSGDVLTITTAHDEVHVFSAS
jgi:antirestriction protein